MVEQSIEKNCRTILSADYPSRCVVEWARTNFGVELKPADITGLSEQEIEILIKQRAKDEAAGDISLSIGEYLEDFDDRSSWDVPGLCRWAMSTFSVNLSPSHVKSGNPSEIEQQLISAAAEQIENRDCSQLAKFLSEDFALRMLVEGARAKFDIQIEIGQLKGMSVSAIGGLLNEKVSAKYKQKEIEYPVEFAMNMAYGPEGPNVYAFETLADWANKKYLAGFSAEHIQNTKPNKLHQQLLELSRAYNNGKLEQEIDEQLERADAAELTGWVSRRFNTSLSGNELAEDVASRRQQLLELGREFLRSELSSLERYVLLQIYDSTWKDHLYAMDHLKDSIWMRSLAEKDPKVEYKHEGFRMFSEMLEAIEDRVTNIIFRVHLEAGHETRSIWRVSSTSHDEVSQFAMSERQRAAAAAPQGEVAVKQIKLEQPKVGRNDPCPCGSGKKYKKCCGKDIQ